MYRYIEYIIYESIYTCIHIHVQLFWQYHRAIYFLRLMENARGEDNDAQLKVFSIGFREWMRSSHLKVFKAAVRLESLRDSSRRYPKLPTRFKSTTGEVLDAILRSICQVAVHRFRGSHVETMLHTMRFELYRGVAMVVRQFGVQNSQNAL